MTEETNTKFCHKFGTKFDIDKIWNAPSEESNERQMLYFHNGI